MEMTAESESLDRQIAAALDDLIRQYRRGKEPMWMDFCEVGWVYGVPIRRLERGFHSWLAELQEEVHRAFDGHWTSRAWRQAMAIERPEIEAAKHLKNGEAPLVSAELNARMALWYCQRQDPESARIHLAMCVAILEGMADGT